MMSMLKKVVLFPISLFVAFLALMAKWLLTLSSYVVAPLMLYIFGCGIYTACRQTWDQFLILLVSEFICFILFFGATAITEGIGRFSEWLATVYKGNIIKNLIMDCQSYTKYRPNETTGGIFVSWRRKEELPTGA